MLCGLAEIINLFLVFFYETRLLYLTGNELGKGFTPRTDPKGLKSSYRTGEELLIFTCSAEATRTPLYVPMVVTSVTEYKKAIENVHVCLEE